MHMHMHMHMHMYMHMHVHIHMHLQVGRLEQDEKRERQEAARRAAVERKQAKEAGEVWAVLDKMIAKLERSAREARMSPEEQVCMCACVHVCMRA